MKKNTVRDTILARRDQLSLLEQTEKSKKIIASLEELPEVQQAQTLFVYVHFRSEVQTLPFIRRSIRAGKTVTVPLTLVQEKKLPAVRITDPDSELRPGYCGIPEPDPKLVQTGETDPGTIDVVIVPGSVFDRRGGRLGYGGGYYDRFLVHAAPRATRVALAYELQVVDTLELQPHDQLMDRLITEENTYSWTGE